MLIRRKAKIRRGMTLPEAIVSIVLLVFVTAIFVGFVNIVRGNMSSTVANIELKIYATKKINEIQIDLEQGLEIDSASYNDSGEESGVLANIYITEVGQVHDKYLYRVALNLSHIETGETVRTETILRRGCVAHAR